MYKVFFNDYGLHFWGIKENSFKDNILKAVDIESVDSFYAFLFQLEQKQIDSRTLRIHFPAPDPVAFLTTKMMQIDAAGGLVENSNGDLLCIKRWGLWDLPKGKIEPGEQAAAAALREVHEECGIADHSIVRPLADSWHLYRSPFIRQHDNWVLKRTCWFKMDCHFPGKLVPQTKEGIDEARWCSPRFIRTTVLQNTYQNLNDLFGGYLKETT